MSDRDSRYQVSVNGFVFSFAKSELSFVDLVKRSPEEFHLIRNHRSVTAQLVESDLSGKRQKLEIAGETFDIEIKDEQDLLLEKMGLGASSNKQVKEIKAPMPGLVLEISVTNGQEVKQGDRILILQAMKMENSIMIHVNARIKKIVVEPGQAVEKGQVLVELE